MACLSLPAMSGTSHSVFPIAAIGGPFGVPVAGIYRAMLRAPACLAPLGAPVLRWLFESADPVQFCTGLSVISLNGERSVVRFCHHAAVIRVDQQVDIAAARRFGLGTPQAIVKLHVLDVLVAGSCQLGLDFVLVELGGSVNQIYHAINWPDRKFDPFLVAAARLAAPHAVLELQALHFLVAGVGDRGLDRLLAQRTGGRVRSPGRGGRGLQ